MKILQNFKVDKILRFVWFNKPQDFFLHLVKDEQRSFRHRDYRRPSVASGRAILATGQGEGRKKYVVLANGDQLTSAGEYWYEQTKQARPNRHFDPNQKTTRRGDGDYIQTNAGLKRVRQLGPDGQMKLTALGKSFYKTSTPNT